MVVPTNVQPSPTQVIRQVVDLPPTEQWLPYTNTQYKYSILYPPAWTVSSENYSVPAGPSSNPVKIFNPADNPATSFYSGMTIEYVGMIPEDLTSYPKIDINGVSVYQQQTSHGDIYYINIPDTDQFIQISGASGNTANEETNDGVRRIMRTFTFF